VFNGCSEKEHAWAKQEVIWLKGDINSNIWNIAILILLNKVIGMPSDDA
jgi:hypothetical protein